MENYLKILEDSLHQKLSVLKEISQYNEAQEKLLKKQDVSLEELDDNMSGKDELIEKLVGLDEGFETLYERIREQLLDGKDTHKAQIMKLQELITQVTEKSVSIQAQEARNKKLIEKYFSEERAELRHDRQTSTVAYNYYKNMSNTNVMPPQYMDQKK